MTLPERDTGGRLCTEYLAACEAAIRHVHETQGTALDQAATLLARQVEADRLIHVYSPGGHSNLAAQEIFYRSGGLMHIAPVLDDGTLLSSGALRATAMERLPGYGRLVIEQSGIGQGDLLLLVNAFGVNAAVIDAATTARRRGATLIGLSSRDAASRIPADHPARHPTGASLHELVDIAIDSGVPDGDASVRLPGLDAPLGPVSTLANAFALNALVLRTIALLVDRGMTPPIWRSRNAAAGDRNDPAMMEKMRQRVHHL